ncbi:MAG: ribonuclease HI [Candidatus Marinimicrobia bacterium]|nr:ribonuclease HI [Candidatus Neomarinimicrobiota bacterium]
MKKVEIFTDGACKGNPGPGGWGAILRYNGTKKEISGFSAKSTNNQMELTAVIKSLKALTQSCQIVLTTDSQYVKNGIETWIYNWKKNGWKTAKKKPVKNKALWENLDKLISKHDVEWQWIRGHSGHTENERADELANLAIERQI